MAKVKNWQKEKKVIFYFGPFLVLLNGEIFMTFCGGAWCDGHHYWDLVDPDTKKVR
jgi:hypothetical protein